MESIRQTTEVSSRRQASTEDADERLQQALQARGELPDHIACIMDGNGRWAQRRGEARVVGHHEGVTSVREITEACAELGVEHLTLYTFSTENWERPDSEVDSLMQLLVSTVREERSTLMDNGVKLQIIGDLSELPDPCQSALEDTKRATADNSRMTLTLALSYSGRWEILQAAQALAEKVQTGEIAPEEIDASLFESQLDTAGMPDPDLLIRTGGEYRLSNFLLWQSAYTELYITEDYWPDFRREQLYGAIRSFQDRDRRFGRIERNAPEECDNGEK